MEPNIPIFMRDWYLDCTTHDNWEIIIAIESDKIIAVFPFKYRRKGSFKFIENPRLTPRLGIWYTNGLTDKKKRKINPILPQTVDGCVKA